MLKIFAITICVWYVSEAHAINDRFISIEQFSNQGKIDFSIKSKGGYTGNCIEFELLNKTSDTLRVLIEAGRRLISEKLDEQDILVVRDTKYELLPLSKAKIDVFGFCCQSSLRSPTLNEKYNLGYVAEKNWLELANFINNSKQDFSIGGIQSAVWSITDLHNPASVIAKPNEPDYLLKKKVAEILKIDLPWYNIDYEQSHQVVFSGRHKKINGEFTFRVSNQCLVSIQIRTKQGKLMKQLLNEKPYHGGEYDFSINQNILNWPKGEYELLVIENNSNLIKKLRIIL